MMNELDNMNLVCKHNFAMTKSQNELKIVFQGNHFKVSVNAGIVDFLNNFASSRYYDSRTKKVEESFFNMRIAPVFRYKIKRMDSNILLYEFKNKDKAFLCSRYNDHPISEAGGKNIVLILESPHQDEFSRMFEPIAPAQGETGIQIEAHICDLLRRIPSAIMDNQIYNLLIVNPVPCQTSLNYLHKMPLQGVYKTLRDKVWKCLWENDSTKIKKEFIKTIETLKPKLILNLCTANLSEYVDRELVQISLKGCKIYKAWHPSSWFKGMGNIEVEKVK